MWKRILLINTNIWSDLLTDYFNVPPLGLEYLVEYVRDIADVDILDARNYRMNYKEIEKHIKKYKPDLVGINCNFTCGIDVAFETARIVKEKYDSNCLVVFGGWHSTLTAEECLKNPWVDVVVRGEGEYTFRELIQTDNFENIKGISYKKNGVIINNQDRPLIENLDELKFPYRKNRKFKKFQMFNIPIDVIETSRGCPYSCEFCCIHIFYHHKWRGRSPINIIKELYELKKLSNIKDILIVDDNFTLDMKRVKKLCELLIKSGLNFHFICQTRVDSIVKNPNIVKLMAKAGFWLMFVGIESITEKGLKDINKKSSVLNVYKAVKILHENNIVIVGNIIIGADLHETEEDVLENINNIRKLQLDFLSYSIITPFPKTKLFEKLNKENLIVNNNWSDYNLKTPVIKTYKLSPQKLYELCRIANIKAMIHRSYKKIYKKFSKSRGILFIIKNGIRSIINFIRILNKALIINRYIKNSIKNNKLT
ncbi:MAG: B12-binding domain-containing radical SAM protein [Candidatus Helarchaeota archaeon]